MVWIKASRVITGGPRTASIADLSPEQSRGKDDWRAEIRHLKGTQGVQLDPQRVVMPCGSFPIKTPWFLKDHGVAVIAKHQILERLRIDILG